MLGWAGLGQSIDLDWGQECQTRLDGWLPAAQQPGACLQREWGLVGHLEEERMQRKGDIYAAYARMGKELNVTETLEKSETKDNIQETYSFYSFCLLEGGQNGARCHC